MKQKCCIFQLNEDDLYFVFKYHIYLLIFIKKEYLKTNPKYSGELNFSLPKRTLKYKNTIILLDLYKIFLKHFIEI